MLVDPLHEDLLYRIGSPVRGFTLWGWGILSPLGVDRVIGALFGGISREDRVYGNRAYQNGKYIKAQLQENLAANSLTKSEVASGTPLRGIETPLVVVSSGIEVRKDKEWENKQEDLTKITAKLLSWDVVWSTLEGRTVMEKRLGELVKASMVVPVNRSEVVDGVVEQPKME
ncbi:hypothetical protein LTR48_008201 [Friedmanniomyces endolithicus]|nr:hypothetical protein LTR48_008201 [Friedmanniomyces endolithicus]